MNLQTEAKERLEKVLTRLTEEDIVERFSIDARTLKRWRTRGIPNPGLVNYGLLGIEAAGLGTPKASGDSLFRFVDLFAGIGGTRLGFEKAGGECVYTSEWDKYSQKTYRANFGADHPIGGDIRDVDPKDIPDHDVLIAGFPCQPFSIAGVSKKNSLGRAHGFDCDTQGTLFFYIEKILEAKQPAAFLLENVKNLQSHDKGRTFDVITRTLHEKLGYEIDFRVIDGKAFTPQHRERIFIVGFKKMTGFNWDLVDLENPDLRAGYTMKDILHPEDGSEAPEKEYTLGPRAEVNKKYILSRKLWDYLKNYAAKHKAKGNGFGYGLVEPDDTCRTLSARYYKDGSEILVSRGKRAHPRRLTPRECARLMGFPDSFEIPVSDTQAYKQFGNSVIVPVVQTVAMAMAPHVVTLKRQEAEEDQLAMVM